MSLAQAFALPFSWPSVSQSVYWRESERVVAKPARRLRELARKNELNTFSTACTSTDQPGDLLASALNPQCQQLELLGWLAD